MLDTISNSRTTRLEFKPEMLHRLKETMRTRMSINGRQYDDSILIGYAFDVREDFLISFLSYIYGREK